MSRELSRTAHPSDLQVGLEASLRKLIALRQQQQDRLARVRALLEQALVRLARAILPDLSEASCQAAFALTGIAALEPPGPQNHHHGERQRLLQRLKQYEGLELYQQAAVLLDPLSGQYTLRLQAARQRLRQADDRLGVYASHPSLLHLIARGYGTPEYSGRFWQLQRWQDFQEARRLLRLFGEDTFEALAAQVRVAEDGRIHARTALLELEASVREVHALQEAVDSLQRQLQELGDVPEQLWQTEVRTFLEKAPLPLLARRTDDALILRLLTLVSALRAKQAYLEELLAGPFLNEEQVIQDALTRLHTPLVDGSRRPWSFPRGAAGDAPPSRLLEPDTSGVRLARLVRCMSAIYEFAGYDFISLSMDPLWWDVFTQGQEDGSFLPSVQDYYEAHPGYACDELGLPLQPSDLL